MYYTQVVYGKPKKCINRKCKAKFFKESIVGYMPCNHSTVWCVVRCPECDDLFAVIQAVSFIKEYANELPSKPKTNKQNAALITMSEIEDVRKKINEENILNSLNQDDGKKYF